jgi:FkbM family methyltransferase
LKPRSAKLARNAPIAAAASKARQNAACDVAFLRGAPVPHRARLRFVAAKYWAIVANARHVSYLGTRFDYDNRLTPALLELYPLDLKRLGALVDLRSARTVLDLGANVGQFAATALALFPGLQVWSLEPNPVSFRLLERNAARNPDWTALPIGVADTDQRRRLWSVPGKSAQASVHRENALHGLLTGEPEATEVDLRRLTPALCAEHGMPATFDLVKIDVEGYEREALSGLRDVLWRWLVVETTTDRAGGVDLDAAVELVGALWSGSRLVHAHPGDGHVGEAVFRLQPAGWTSVRAPDEGQRL